MKASVYSKDTYPGFLKCINNFIRILGNGRVSFNKTTRLKVSHSWYNTYISNIISLIQYSRATSPKWCIFYTARFWTLWFFVMVNQVIKIQFHVWWIYFHWNPRFKTWLGTKIIEIVYNREIFELWFYCTDCFILLFIYGQNALI